MLQESLKGLGEKEDFLSGMVILTVGYTPMWLQVLILSFLLSCCEISGFLKWLLLGSKFS